MNIEHINRSAFTAIGLLVEAHWNELPRAIPAAWNELFARQSELTPSCGPLGQYLEVSVQRQDGFYRELVGVIVQPDVRPPAGMVKLLIPANRYLRLVHDGPLAGITDGFQSLYDQAEAEGIEASDFKLDIGYRPGLPPGRHELLVGLAPLVAPQQAA